MSDSVYVVYNYRGEIVKIYAEETDAKDFCRGIRDARYEGWAVFGREP